MGRRNFLQALVPGIVIHSTPSLKSDTELNLRLPTKQI
jgi:hypothetical protein